MLVISVATVLACCAMYLVVRRRQRITRIVESLSEPRMLALLFLGTALLFVLGTWAFSLTDRDEAYYSAVAREMLCRHELLVPTFLGTPWLEKPPLVYWMMMGSQSLLGQTTLAVRLPAVLSGALVAVVIALFSEAETNFWALLRAAMPG